MGAEVSTRKIFSTLDADGDGDINLRDILLVGEKDVPGLDMFHQSPLLMFTFDEGGDGALNGEEFERMLKHLKLAQKRVHDDWKKIVRHRAEAARDDSSDSSSEEPGAAPVWVALNSASAKQHVFARDSETPSVTGQHQADADPSEISAEYLRERRTLMLQSIMLSMMRNQGMRDRYMHWLFRLADVDRDNDLGVDELALILQALEKDGIPARSLAYTNLKAPREVARHLVKQYDSSGSGQLSQRDFLKLADLVMKQYSALLSLESRGRMIGPYVLKRKLGSGSAGVVRLAIHRDTGERVAIKIIKRGDMTELSKLDNEIKAMMMMRHERIVELYEVLESAKHVFFVMELAGGGTLSNYVEMKPLSEAMARFYIPQLVRGVRYCHKMGVCHRDLKLENMLLDNQGNLKISDFGHAGIFAQGWDVFSTGLVGSIHHIAPEQVAGQAYSGEKRDIWGIGVILYRLLVGVPPFWSENAVELFDAIANVRYHVPETLSPDAQSLIALILKKDPAERPSCRKILSHPWFKLPGKRPALARFLERLGPSLDRDDALDIWEHVIESIRECNVHVIDDENNKGGNGASLRTTRCVYPDKDIKFRVLLKSRRKRKGGKRSGARSFYLDYRLDAGESWEFSDTLYRIRRIVKRRMKVGQAGGQAGDQALLSVPPGSQLISPPPIFGSPPSKGMMMSNKAKSKVTKKKPKKKKPDEKKNKRLVKKKVVRKKKKRKPKRQVIEDLEEHAEYATSQVSDDDEEDDEEEEEVEVEVEVDDEDSESSSTSSSSTTSSSTTSSSTTSSSTTSSSTSSSSSSLVVSDVISSWSSSSSESSEVPIRQVRPKRNGRKRSSSRKLSPVSAPIPLSSLVSSSSDDDD